MKTITNLSDEQIKNRAYEIVRYQNFKTKIALKKMNCTMPKLTFDSGVAYIKRGTVNKAVLSTRLIKEIDNYLNKCVQPLTPMHSERRVIFSKKYQQKDAKPPVSNLEIVNNPVTSKFKYGVQIGHCIKVLDSEKEARGFIKGAKFVNKSIIANLVELELNKVEEEV